MRLLASNPDTIGDLVLRQPLYRALLDGGHELTLIVRASVEPVVRLVAPGAKTLVLPREVYGGVDAHWDEFAGLIAAARATSPDLLLVAAYQWTRFEERLATELRSASPGIIVAGMNGRLFPGDPFGGSAPLSDLRMDRVAEVDEDLHEAEKNAALAALLGCPVASVDPVLTPDEPAIAEARQVLATVARHSDAESRAQEGFGIGMTSYDGFWLACVTGTANVSIKSWPAERWAAVLKGWHERYGRRFLFVGLPNERPFVEQVQAAMGEAAGATAVWMEPGGSVETLAALASLAKGYVGHDTGPMHIAAAVDKPVLAVFGGGHKLRFTPRVSPSVSLAVRVPCAGCGWACSFEKAHCVQALSVEHVLAAVDDLEAGRITDREARLQPLSPVLHDYMTGFAADLARHRARAAADLTQQNDLLGKQLASSNDHVKQLEAGMDALNEESAGLIRQVQEREATIAELNEALALANQQTVEEKAGRAADLDQLRGENAGLLKQIDSLKLQLAQPKLAEPAAQQPAAAAPPPAVRKRWRDRLVDWVIGTRNYIPPAGPRPMPKICIVTRITAGDSDEMARATVDSVLAERYPHLEYVLAVDDVDRPVLAEYRDRVSRIVPAGEQPFSGVVEAFAASDAEALGWLDIGQEYEPGALMRAATYLRDHSRAAAITMGFTLQSIGHGWRFPHGPPNVTVEYLLRSGGSTSFAFFRRPYFGLLAPMNPAKGEAAGWDLIVRFARRYGIRQGHGDGVCITDNYGRRTLKREADVAEARATFEKSYGFLGRIRGKALNWFSTLKAATSRRGRSKQWWAPVFEVSSDFPAAAAPPFATAVSPVTHQRPDRLLFSSPDVTTDDKAVHRVYYDSTGDAAVTFPPIDGQLLERLYVQRTKCGSEVIPPTNPAQSPYRGFRARPRWTGWIGRLPSPYWRLAHTRPGEESTAARMVRLLGSGAPQDDAEIRLLVVGAFDGSMLDELKQLTRWQLSGTETNPAVLKTAQAKGHEVWPCSPQEAFTTIPDGRVFDVILIPAMLQHWPDPPWVLRRLVRLLLPGGRIVVRTPNLDSRLLDLFGPTWWHWQLPYHRTLLGRRGLRSAAAMADLRVAKLKTITDAYSAAASVQLNQVGLAGVVPVGAAFSPQVSAAGARLAGWARMLWDRWGRGDEMWAVLEAM